MNHLLIPVIHSISSLHSRLGSKKVKKIGVEVVFKEENSKKQKKNKKKDNVQLLLSKKTSRVLRLPHAPGEIVQVSTLDTLAKLISIDKDHFNLSHQECLQQLMTGDQNLIDYLLVTKSQLSILKPFSRKLNSLGLMPSLQNGTLVENAEQLERMSQILINNNVKRFQFAKNSISLIIGNSDMDFHLINENITHYLDWVLESISKKDIKRIQLLSFNSNVVLM